MFNYNNCKHVGYFGSLTAALSSVSSVTHGALEFKKKLTFNSIS